MILANITTPLLGLVDTAVMGHMDSSAMLAGASIGALILTQIYWVCGFLRMSTTGLSAQAKGQTQRAVVQATKVLWQGGVVAIALGVMLFILQAPILHIGLLLADPNAQVAVHTDAYFSVRVWGAPAALLNMVMIGWLVGQQRTKAVMTIQIVGNMLNVGLDLLFVLGFSWSVAGVALASVIAEYTMVAMALIIAFPICKNVAPQKAWFSRTARKAILSLNSNILLRNLMLQLCLAFLTFQGARYGQTAAAVNAILMQFFVLIALGLDGVAYAVEALVGEAAGSKKHHKVWRTSLRGLFWSSLFALLYACGFYLAGDVIIKQLTDIAELQNTAMAYLPLMIGLPLVGHWCFLFDGVFVGLTRAKAMRNTMILSALIYFPTWYVFRDFGNEALWYALLAFLFTRGVTLGGYFVWLSHRK
ncbi:MATE family efflux transporter [Alteromonas sp. ASW11-130]|uniref:MATE family efflux transporter n=1 Tax=Alteromonas sp. ASW11-130 TaxID=3015775 RepID=UPI0022421ABE|nr:MATE family efflux transporter [Alteromonas sp. ASW11-130]MCW8093324.1 MATE family efflux transporter [Alteromonas sp. ASW11-130]